MSFFSHNRIKLVFSRGDLACAPSEQEMQEQVWVLENEEVRALYHVANIRNRGLLLTLYHSGLSPIDTSNLNIEDLKEGLNTVYDIEEGHMFIERFREKTNIKQRTCISTECIHDLRAYLKQRGNPEKGALFVSEKGKRLNPRFINEAMKQLCEDAHGKEARKAFKTKNLRDSFRDGLAKANITKDTQDAMMGWKREGASPHYKFTKSTIKMAFEKAFKFLSVNGGEQARADMKQLTNTVEGLAQVITQQGERIRELEGILTQNNIDYKMQFQKLTDRVVALEKEEKKRPEKVDYD